MTACRNSRTVAAMPGDVGPFQAQWNLRPRIDAIRAEAKTLRQQNTESHKTKETDLAIQRDRLAREQYGAEQQAKSADIQVGVENKEVQRIQDGLAKREARMAADEKRGDTSKLQEDREDVAAWRAEQATHEARARQATLDAAELREQAAGIDRQRTELSVERTDLAKQTGKIEDEIDKMEQQADVLQQARLKYAEADLSDDVSKRATLELEAEALVTKAAAIEVDRSLIRTVVPELPETTPGLDADPGPLPAGTEEVSSTGFTDEDGPVTSADPDSSDGATDSGAEETAAATPDLTGEGGDSIAKPGAGTTNTLDDDVFVDTAGGSTVNASASDSTLGATGDFGDAAGFGGTVSESIVGDGEQQAGVDSSGVEEPAAPAFADSAGSVDSGVGGDAITYEERAYEAPAYEALAYEEPAYGDAGDFAAPADADTGYVEPTYESESYEV